MAKKNTAGKTIDEALKQFLMEQQARVSPATYRKYETVVDLFKAYCERYWPGHSDEYDRVTKAGGTFCGSYGPEDILGGYSEFLGYFMPHKVLGSKETMKAAGTVTKSLAKWLAARGHVGEVEDAVDEAKPAADRPEESAGGGDCGAVRRWACFSRGAETCRAGRGSGPGLPPPGSVNPQDGRD